jgi:hypothetical protein
VFVTDESIGRFQQFTLDGAFLAEFGISPGSGPILDHPDEITVDEAADIVYVTEAGTANEVSLFNIAAPPNDAFISKLGEGSLSNFSSPHAVSYDPNTKQVFVGSTGNERIYIYKADAKPKVSILAFSTVSAGTLEATVVPNIMFGSCGVKATGTLTFRDADPSDPFLQPKTYHLKGPRVVVPHETVKHYHIPLSEPARQDIDEALKGPKKNHPHVHLVFEFPGGCNGEAVPNQVENFVLR